VKTRETKSNDPLESTEAHDRENIRDLSKTELGMELEPMGMLNFPLRRGTRIYPKKRRLKMDRHYDRNQRKWMKTRDICHPK
jgi:hypothetical protein